LTLAVGFPILKSDIEMDHLHVSNQGLAEHYNSAQLILIQLQIEPDSAVPYGRVA
jgi:hypothetical protein